MPDSADTGFFEPPERFLRIGLGLAKAGKGDAARDLVCQALALFPDRPLYRELGREILSAGMHEYHFAMLHDRPRNALYRKAIERVAKGRVVLDIGTGSGLLAMMAARAGAERVIACEATPTMAATAQAIIAANGLADRITVHACHSGKLDRARDLHGGADLVVSELVASDWVGEGIQVSLEHARQELAAPDALFVPPEGAIRVALAHDPDHVGALGEVEDFDLSALNDHLQPTRAIRPGSKALALRSEAADLHRFTYRSDTEIPLTGHGQARLRARGGVATGILQWVRLDFGHGDSYENAPDSAAELHWDLFYHPFDRPIDPGEGAEVCVSGMFDKDHLILWLDQPA